MSEIAPAVFTAFCVQRVFGLCHPLREDLEACSSLEAASYPADEARN